MVMLLWKSDSNPRLIRALVTASRCVGATRFKGDSFAGDRAGDEESARLDAIGNHFVLRAVQFFHALDEMRRVPAPSIFAPILLRKLARSTTSGSAAAPSMTVSPSARTAAIITLSVPRTVGRTLPRKLIDAARRLPAKDFDVATLDAIRPHRALQIPSDARSIGRSPMTHPPGSETVAFFLAAQQRPEHANRSAHFAHDVIRRLGGDLLRLHGHRATGALHLRTEMRQDLQHVVDVAQIRNVMDDARLLGEQRRRENRERGVF